MPAGSYFPGGGGGSGLELSDVVGDLVLDVRDYGGAADGSLGGSATNNVVAFRAAYSALKTLLGANTSRRRGYVRFPGANDFYATNRPLIIQDPYIGISGDYGQSEIKNGGYGPTVIVGIRDIDDPSGTPVKLDSTYWPSRTAYFDGTISGYGFRTKGNSTVICSCCPLTEGKPSDTTDEGLGCWANIRQLTLDMAMAKGDGSTGFTGSTEYGIWQFGGYDSPNMFRMSKGGVAGQFDWYLTDSGGNAGQVSIATTPASGAIKISLQIDLQNKTAQCWVNGTQTAVNITGDAFGVSGTGYFRLNERDAIVFGADNNSASGRAPVQVATPTSDITFYAFSLEASLRYANNGVGTSQARLDAGTLNDSYRYDSYSAFARYWAAHPATDNTDPLHDATNPWTCRLVSFFSAAPFKIFYGYFMQTAMHTVSGGQDGNTIKDVILKQVDQRLGPVVAFGPTLDLRFERCRFEGGHNGICQIPTLASYLVRIHDCLIDAKNIGIFGAWTAFDVIRTEFKNSGRWPIMTWASNCNTADMWLYFHNPWCRSYVCSRAGQYGMRHTHTRWFCDAEGDACLVGPFDFEQQDSLLTTVVLADMTLEGASVGKPLITLKAAATPLNEAVVLATMVGTAAANYQYKATVTGSGWSGKIHVIPASGPGINYTHQYGSGENVTVGL